MAQRAIKDAEMDYFRSVGRYQQLYAKFPSMKNILKFFIHIPGERERKKGKRNFNWLFIILRNQPAHELFDDQRVITFISLMTTVCGIILRDSLCIIGSSLPEASDFYLSAYIYAYFTHCYANIINRLIIT